MAAILSDSSMPFQATSMIATSTDSCDVNGCFNLKSAIAYASAARSRKVRRVQTDTYQMAE